MPHRSFVLNDKNIGQKEDAEPNWPAMNSNLRVLRDHIQHPLT